MRLQAEEGLDTGRAAGEWIATTDAPRFRCTSGAGEGGFDAGWYQFEFDASSGRGPLQDAVLLPDYGPGATARDAIALTSLARGTQGVKGVVLFKFPVQGLRLVPCHDRQPFVIRTCALRRITRSEALARLLSDNLRIVAPGRRVAWLAGLASDLRRHGLRRVVAHLYEAVLKGAPLSPDRYPAWLRQYDDRAVRASDPADGPLLSVIVPTHDTPVPWLRDCIESVLAQRYRTWELCIADDASTAPATLAYLDGVASRDARIKLERRTENGHIAAATNTALAMARGEFVVFLDHDDRLHPDALAEIAAAVRARPDWDMVYSDEDKLDGERRTDPYFKPHFDPDLLLGHNMVTHLCAIRRSVLHDVGGMRAGLDGAQDWDLVLRVRDQVGDARIGHVPRVLYHWRRSPGSTAADPMAKPYAGHAALRAIGEHLARNGIEAVVEPLAGHPGNYRVRHALPEVRPKVSVLVPSRDQPAMLLRCLASVAATASGFPLEFVLVDNGSRTPEAAQAFQVARKQYGATVVRDDDAFNFARLNNLAAKHATGDVFLLLNDDIEAITPGWLDELISHALRPGVGAVGAKLLYPDGRIQHAGVVLGADGIAAHPWRGEPGDSGGQHNRALLAQRFSAVTAACMALTRSAFERVGGFDEALAVDYNDVDLCLRLQAAGLHVVWTPFAVLVHHESATRGASRGEDPRAEREATLMRARWGAQLRCDPAYNPNLGLESPLFALAFPPRPCGTDDQA